MKTLFFTLLIISLFVFPAIAYAQDPTAEPTAEATAEPLAEPVVDPPLFPVEIPEVLPETAAKGVDVLALALGALAGLVSKYLTNGIKSLPFLTDEDRSKVTGPAAILLAGVVSIVTGYVLSYAGVAANFLDSSGVWQVILTAWPWAFKFYHDSVKPVTIDFPVHTT